MMKVKNKHETIIETLRAIAQENNGIIETKTAIQYGISKMTLSNFSKRNVINRIAHGQYIFSDDLPDELYSISLSSKNIVFSHDTALFLHGISDRTPFIHSVTAPSNSIPSATLKNKCQIFYISQDLFLCGKIYMKTPADNLVPCYNLERTICDLIRSRKKIGTETFIYALQQYASNSKKDLNLLYEYAQKMQITNLVRQYLEVLL